MIAISTTSTQPTSLAQDDPKSAKADPLGPDSLTWKYFGDLRTGMLGV